MDLQLKKISVAIKKISTKNFDKIDVSFDLIALVNIDGREENISKRYKYGIKMEDLAADFLKMIKDKFSGSNYDSYTFNHNIIVIEKFDETEEKIMAFARKINDKVKDFKEYKRLSYFEMSQVMNNLSMNI